MDKRKLVNAWILLELILFVILSVITLTFISYVSIPFDYFLFVNLFSLLLIFVIVLGIIISFIGFREKIKFSGNLLIISLVFIVILSLFSWSFLVFPSPWDPWYTQRKVIQLIDYSCANGTIFVILRNAGIEPISLGVCNEPNIITGSSSFACGDIIITKTAGGNLKNGELSAVSLSSRQMSNYTEDCGIDMNCSYRFLIKGETGPTPNIATISC